MKRIREVWQQIKIHWERWLTIVAGIVALAGVGYQYMDYRSEQQAKFKRFNTLNQDIEEQYEYELTAAHAFLGGAHRSYGGSALNKAIHPLIGETPVGSWKKFARRWHRHVQLFETAYERLAECFKFDQCIRGEDDEGFFCHNILFAYQAHQHIKSDIIEYGNETQAVSITSAGQQRFNDGDIHLITPASPNLTYLSNDVCAPKRDAT